MKHYNARTFNVDTFLTDHNIVIRTIPGETWVLSLDMSNRTYPKYVLTEESSPRMRAQDYQPRVYRYGELTAVLLAFLCDPVLKHEDRQAKFEEKYPVMPGSNVVRIDMWRGGAK